jgi:hypothetical protein
MPNIKFGKGVWGITFFKRFSPEKVILRKRAHGPLHLGAAWGRALFCLDRGDDFWENKTNAVTKYSEGQNGTA